MTVARNWNVAGPVIEDAEYWRALCCWHLPTMGAAQLADAIGLKEDSVRQYISRGIGELPAPKPGSRPMRWSPAQAYMYLFNHRQNLADRVPRIFPHRDPEFVNPAVFLAAEQHPISAFKSLGIYNFRGFSSRRTPVIGHYWQPSDGRGPIAVLYPAIPGAEILRGTAINIAATAIKFLAPIGFEAVAVITDELRALNSGSGKQAAVIVAEPGSHVHTPAENQIRPCAATLEAANEQDPVSLYEIGWFDLTYLLRNDLPWWPIELREADSIMSWSPTREPDSVPPGCTWYRHADMNALGKVLNEEDPTDGPRIQDILARADRRIQAQIYAAPLGADDLPGGLDRTPGITPGAQVAFSMQKVPTQLTEQEVRWLLHQQYPRGYSLTSAVAALWSLDEFRAIAGTSTRVKLQELGPLAQEWFNRLEPAPQHTIGHAYTRARCHYIFGEISGETFIDPLNPLAWAIRSKCGTAGYATGQAPAQGVLVDFEQESEHTARFFRDSDGIVWPLPWPAGDGGRNFLLASVLTALRADAAADLNHPNLPAQNAALHALVVGRRAPWTLTGREIDQALAQPHTVCTL